MNTFSFAHPIALLCLLAIPPLAWLLLRRRESGPALVVPSLSPLVVPPSGAGLVPSGTAHDP